MFSPFMHDLGRMYITSLGYISVYLSYVGMCWKERTLEENVET